MTTMTTTTATAAVTDRVASLPQTIEEAQKYLANPSTRQILDFYSTSPYLRDTAFAYHTLEDTSFGTTEDELLLSLPLLPLEELFSIHDLLNVEASAPAVVQWDNPTEGNHGGAADEDEDYWVTEQDIKAIGKLFNASGVCESLWAQAVLGLPKAVVAGLLAKTRLKEQKRKQKKEQKKERRKSKNAQKQVRQEPEKLEKSEPQKLGPQQPSREDKKARRKRKREAARHMAVKEEVAEVTERVDGDQKKQAEDGVEVEAVVDKQKKASDVHEAERGDQKKQVDVAVETGPIVDKQQEMTNLHEALKGDQKIQVDDEIEAEPTDDKQTLTAAKRKRMNRKKSRAIKKQKVNGEAHAEEPSKELDVAESVNANAETLFEKPAEPNRIENGTALELDYIEQQAVVPPLQPGVTEISIEGTSRIIETAQDKVSSDNSQEDARENHITIIGSSELTITSGLPPSPAQIAPDMSASEPVPSHPSIILMPPNDPCTEANLAPRRTIRKTTSPSKSPYFAPSKASTPRQKLSPTKSPYFSPATSKPASSPRVPAGTSCLPFPPLSSATFGLIQETLAHTPFHLLLAVSLLNKTRGSVAIPIIHALIARYPTPESMAIAGPEDIVPLIRHLGLQNNRAKTMVAMARMWVAQVPCKGKRFRTLNYPYKGAGKGIGRHEVLPDEDDDSAGSAGEEEVEIGDAVGEDMLYEDTIVEAAVAIDAMAHNAANRDSIVHSSKTGNVIDLEDYDETISNDSHTDDEARQSDHTPLSTPSPTSKAKSKAKAKLPSETKKPRVKTKLSPSSKRHTSGAWEIAHLPGVGAYAIDSWRIFCRDVLRGVATGWDGEDAEALATVFKRPSCTDSRSANAKGHDADTDMDTEAEAEDEETHTEQSSLEQHPELMSGEDTRSDFEPEWTRVLPLDKELRTYLRWKWLKRGWVWDQLTGKKTRVKDMEEAVKQVSEDASGEKRTEGRKGQVVEEMEVAKVEAVEVEGKGEGEEGGGDVEVEQDVEEEGAGEMADGASLDRGSHLDDEVV